MSGQILHPKNFHSAKTEPPKWSFVFALKNSSEVVNETDATL